MSRYQHPEIPAEQATYIAAHGARPLNLYRILANQPLMLEAWLRFAYALRGQCATARSTRELMILRTAQLHNSEYEWQQHEPMALDAGASIEQIKTLAYWPRSKAFSRHEKAALKLTEAMFHGRVSTPLHTELAALYSEADLIELVLTAGFYMMVPRVLAAIDVNIDGEEDAECDHATRAFERRLTG